MLLSGVAGRAGGAQPIDPLPEEALVLLPDRRADLA